MTLKYPDKYKLLYGSALNKHNKKDHKGAIQNYKRTLELNPNFLKVYCMLAFLAKDKEESHKFANQYLIRNPNNIFAKFILASSHQQANIFNLDEVLEQQPEYVRALNELGNIYAGKKMYDEAIERYKICTAISQNYFKPVINIGKTYFLSGDRAKAVEYFEQLIDTNLPTDYRSEALYELATIYKQSKDWKRAIACFKEYL